MTLDPASATLSRPGFTFAVTWPMVTDIANGPAMTLLMVSPREYIPLPHAALPGRHVPPPPARHPRGLAAQYGSPTMTATPDAVLFDCDGVLVDSEGPTFDLLSDELARHGLPLPRAEMEALFLGGTIPGLFHKARLLGAPPARRLGGAVLSPPL